MVVSFHATVANYEYLVYWRFYPDGSIECEVRATGVMVTAPLAADGDRSQYGATVDRRTYAPYHQHFIVARLDLDVDGPANTAVQLDADVLPTTEENPYGLAMTTKATVIASEAESARDPSWATQRTWSVANPNRTNAHGDPVAYKIIPTGAIPSLLDPASPVYQRAPVIGHTLWVTAYDDTERWPAGDYPTQSGRDGGITRWIAADAPLVDADVVLWYVFGIHHITRPEDWPVMPADAVSFWLKPFGFFDRNPALDLAP
jgi:primary-amine oxidase